jgi:AcrR family transcriptional regulator
VGESPDRRTRRWAATHQRIYDAALELFQEHGFDAVNVGQIARRAGVSVPTFYAHYPSREHIVMRLPTAEQVTALVAQLPVDLPLAERLRLAVSQFLASWTGDILRAELARWRVIAASPSLRTQAAAFERATAGFLARALPAEPGGTLAPAEWILLNAYMSAYTAALLAWADGNGERKLDEVIDEAFEALQQH